MAGSKLTGLDEVLTRIEKMRVGTQNKHIRKALRKSMVPVRDQAKLNAKTIDDYKTASEIHKNIVIRAGKTKEKGVLKIRVGVKHGGEFWKSNKKMQRKGRGRLENPHYDALQNDTRYFWLVELGTSKTAAQPYLRPAFEQKKDEAQAIFTAELKKAILEELR
ncbi:hypothetical protein AY606_05980 [Acinetobacter sp. SFB]|uniref:HK97-gp10 family putative phage morphogenesis protein n=1 Tax=Acinetobacter sp. SFB TaxID=1805634 RepID=UPI0007D87E31|nr:HK97-gp10 family putative phage morphogenesis protein [Acinetobacter sp. SFB]OAL78974.1 hypothetical protein AY606_05980 [Acinetobacter sp. SFB]